MAKKSFKKLVDELLNVLQKENTEKFSTELQSAYRSVIKYKEEHQQKKQNVENTIKSKEVATKYLVSLLTIRLCDSLVKKQCGANVDCEGKCMLNCECYMCSYGMAKSELETIANVKKNIIYVR